MTLANHVPQRTIGCYHVPHPWPLTMPKDQFLPAVQNIMHNSQMNSSYAIKIGGSNYLRYMKHNTITWTVGFFSLIFFVLVKKLRHEVEVPSTAQSRLPLLDGAQTQSDYELAGDESCNQYSFSVEKRIISVTHCGLWPCRIYICISLALAWIQLYMFKWSVS